MENKKRNKVILLVILLLAISVGFAALATTLKINGSTSVTKQTWEIYWDNASIVPTTNLATADIVKAAQTKTGDVTTLEWEVNLHIPGDYYEFTVDAVNNGSIDAMITSIDSKIGTDSIISTENGQLVEDESVIPSYLKYDVTYEDGTKPELNHLLAKKTNGVATREKYKVRVEYNKDLNSDDLDEVTSPVEELTFTYSVTYGQADNNAVDRVGLVLQAGDYFTLVPDVTNYTIPTGMTGYEDATRYTQETLHPNELTLWRVINVNNDGTVDAVSEYLSSTRVVFRGVTGYTNYVQALQTIAGQYQKSGYTVGARMMGYDGQTLTIQDTSGYTVLKGGRVGYPSYTSAPRPTAGTGEEWYDGKAGDTLYLRDIQLVGNVYTDSSTYGNLGTKAAIVGTDDYSGYYWLASREYYDDHNLSYSWDVYRGHALGKKIGGSVSFIILYDDSTNLEPEYDEDAYYIRPIITLKKGVAKASGTGTISEPYAFK